MLHNNVHRARRNRQAGFTIVELLIVIVVIAVLASITIVSYNGITQRARVVSLQSDLQSIATQLEIDKASTGIYPATTALVNGGAGLKKGANTTVQYTTPYGADGGYCVTVSDGTSFFYRSSASGSMQTGSCAGHNTVALSCPAGYVQVPGSVTFGTSDFCVMKYEAKNVGGVPTSQAASTPWTNISQSIAISTISSTLGGGYHLISEAEWMTIAANVLSVPSNWSGGAVGSGFIYSGHHDNSPANTLAASTDDADGYNGTGNTAGSNQRRTLTLTNGAVMWDLSGNLWELTSGTVQTGQPGISGEACYGWKEWSAINVAGTIVPDPRPISAIAGSSSWGSAQGIGKLYSCSSETVTLRGFLRGGDFVETSPYDSPDTAGILALALGTLPTTVDSTYTFRVAK